MPSIACLLYASSLLLATVSTGTPASSVPIARWVHSFPVHDMHCKRYTCDISASATLIPLTLADHVTFSQGLGASATSAFAPTLETGRTRKEISMLRTLRG